MMTKTQLVRAIVVASNRKLNVKDVNMTLTLMEEIILDNIADTDIRIMNGVVATARPSKPAKRYDFRTGEARMTESVMTPKFRYTPQFKEMIGKIPVDRYDKDKRKANSTLANYNIRVHDFDEDERKNKEQVKRMREALKRVRKRKLDILEQTGE